MTYNIEEECGEYPLSISEVFNHTSFIKGIARDSKTSPAIKISKTSLRFSEPFESKHKSTKGDSLKYNSNQGLFVSRDESFVRLGTNVQLIRMDHPDDFQKFRLNFKAYSAKPIWTIWMEMIHSIWYNVYYASNVIHKLQT